MLLFVIFDEKKIRIGVWFSCNFSGFLAIGTYIVTDGAGEKSCCQWCRFSYLWCYCLWCNLVTKSKSSCQWCTLAFCAVTTGHYFNIKMRLWVKFKFWKVTQGRLILAWLFIEYDVARKSQVLHWNFSISRATSCSVNSQATVHHRLHHQNSHMWGRIDNQKIIVPMSP